jgi:hypothetical protein
MVKKISAPAVRPMRLRRPSRLGKPRWEQQIPYGNDSKKGKG